MKPILTILEPEHFSKAALAKLDEVFRLETHCLGLEPLYDQSTEVLWARLRPPKQKLDCFSNLRLIACNCTDTSHLPLEECERRGIDVLSLKGIEGLDNVHATAEHTISLMLQALRHRADRSSGRIGRELREKTVCLIGRGRIGHQVGLVLEESFDVETYVYQPEYGDAFLDRCDIVSIHASLNETSKGMVNAEFLAKLKPGCILVNTARHAIVDENAILDWLDRDKESIYAHDFADDFNAVGAWDRIIATPHIGGWTIESLHKTEELLAEKVIEWAKARMEVSV